MLAEIYADMLADMLAENTLASTRCVCNARSSRSAAISISLPCLVISLNAISSVHLCGCDRQAALLLDDLRPSHGVGCGA